jgi:hypothetical protein
MPPAAQLLGNEPHDAVSTWQVGNCLVLVWALAVAHLALSIACAPGEPGFGVITLLVRTRL